MTYMIICRRNNAFLAGFRSGQKGETSSAREVSERYPSMTLAEISTYLNGQEDGRADDRWRLKNLGIEP